MNSALVTVKMTVAAAVFIGFLYVSQTTTDPDIWWHLRIGEWEIANRSIPHFDEYSFTMPGHRWVNHEWLVDAWLWWAKSRGAWWIVGAIFTALAFTPFALWIKRSKSLLGLAVILTAANFMMNLVGIRPQMITVFLFFVLFEVIRKRFEDGRNYFWLLPIFFLIWANLHGGFAVGLAFAGFVLAVYYVMKFVEIKTINFAELRRDILIILASTAATLVNPYGIELYQELYHVLLSEDTAKYIAEWQSVLSVYALSSVFIISIFAALALFRDFRKNYALPLFCGAIVALLLALKSVRHAPIFLISAMPFMLAAIDKLESIMLGQNNFRFKKRTGLMIVIIMVFSFAAFGYRVYRAGNYPYPVSAVEFLKNEQARTGGIRVFNDYGWGGYLIYHAPEIKVFIDGRMPHWVDESGEGAMKDMVDVYFRENPDAWREVFERRRINVVLTANDKTFAAGFRAKVLKRLLGVTYIRRFYNYVVKEESVDIKQSLRENNWRVVYEDDAVLIFRCEGKDCYGDL